MKWISTGVLLLVLSTGCHGQEYYDWLFSKYTNLNQSSKADYISTGLQPNYLLKGRAGNKRIVMQLDTFSNDVSGEFCYQSGFKSYFYHGKKTSDSLVLNFEDRGVSTFYLTAKKANWKGTLYEWSSKKTKRVRLTPYNINKIKPNEYVDVKSTYLFDGFSYHTLRWKKLRYKNTGQTTYADKYVIQHKLEPSFNTSFFTIAKGYDSLSTAQLNRYLQQSVFDNYISNLSSNATVVLCYLDSNYISYYTIKNEPAENCKGKNYRSVEVFNVHTGIPLSLKELLGNKDYYSIIVAELLNMYPNQRNTLEKYCAVKDNFPFWYLSPKGITILSSTGKIDCEYEEWFIPYEKLKQHFNVDLH